MLGLDFYKMTENDWASLREMKPKGLLKQTTFWVQGVHSPYNPNEYAGYTVCYCGEDIAYFAKYEEAKRYVNKLWKSI